MKHPSQATCQLRPSKNTVFGTGGRGPSVPRPTMKKPPPGPASSGGFLSRTCFSTRGSPPTEADFHINKTTRPIPTRVYKLVTVMPRQTSAMTLSGWGLICLPSIAPLRAIAQPTISSRNGGFVPVPWREKAAPTNLRSSIGGRQRAPCSGPALSLANASAQCF